MKQKVLLCCSHALLRATENYSSSNIWIIMRIISSEHFSSFLRLDFSHNSFLLCFAFSEGGRIYDSSLSSLCVYSILIPFRMPQLLVNSKGSNYVNLLCADMINTQESPRVRKRKRARQINQASSTNEKSVFWKWACSNFSPLNPLFACRQSLLCFIIAR